MSEPVDVITSPACDVYVRAVREAIAAGRLAVSDMRVECPECGEAPAATPGGNPHRMIGAYVVIGCEGYYVVDPNRVGIYTPGWRASDDA